jgi:signal transduction histidine kinase
MSAEPPAPESITELLREQIRHKARIWSYAAVAAMFLGIALTLVTLAALFGGEIALTNPLSLLVAALILSLLVFAGRWGYRSLETTTIQKSPLVQRGRQAITQVQEISGGSSTREEIGTTLGEEIDALFHPEHLEIVLHHPRTHQYQALEADVAFPTDDPFVTWIVNHPLNTPIPLPADVPEPAAETQRRVLAREIVMLVPLGKQGWIGLGKPQDAEAYGAAQRSLLHFLARPTAVGLERATIIESQQKRAQELRSLYWIAQAINFSMELDDLMELIYTQLKRVITFPNFYIAMKDPDEDELGFAFYIEEDERLYPNYTWPLDAGLTGVIIANSMTIRTDSYIEECRRRGIEPSGLKPGEAWMGTPLTAGDKSVGVMVASTFDPDVRFTEEDENFFVTVAAYTAAILERQSLYDRLEARAQQLGTLNAIGNLLASSLDLNEVLDLVVRNAAKLLNSEAGSLLLLDEDSGDLIFRISSGQAGAKLVGMHVPAGKGIAGAALSENRPIITHDTHRDQRWDGSFDEKSEFVTQSIIAVPLNARGRTIGVLEVLNRKDNRPFNDEDAELLLSFAAQAAIAIENANLFTMTDQALQARLEELTTLQRIDRQLNATLDYGAVMGQTLEWAIRITDATIGLISALQEEEDGTQGLRFLAHRGYPEEVFQRYAGEELWPLNAGLLGQTVMQGETSLVKDVNEDPHYEELVPGMQAQLTVPIKREERVIGVIALESAQADSFSDENVALIMRLADHAAIAIENAMLFERVQRANDAKTEFVSFVSHELKQPMTSMKGYTDLLRKGIGGPLNDQQQQFLQVIRNNVSRMDRLVQDLLDVSRIESGRLRLEMGPVVPEEIVSEAVQAFQQEITTKDQDLQVEIEPNLPTITGDRGRLIQVLTNLVSNANKYTDAGGTITISAGLWEDDGEDYVRWSVQDTGIGMTPEELERLFTKYFRGSAARKVQGTGLGLVITRSIVEMHGGEMMVDSEYQKGSTFSFAVPLTLDAA